MASRKQGDHPQGGRRHIWDIARIPYVRNLTTHLGYPSYFLVLLGCWKVLGAVALLVPRRPLLKEWAYAGAFFTYTGAVVSHLTTGYDLGELPLLIALTALTVLSRARMEVVVTDRGRAIARVVTPARQPKRPAAKPITSAVVPLLIADPGSVRAASSKSMTPSLATPASWLKLTDCADLTRSISRLRRRRGPAW